jgi:hypothetical protein
MSMDRVHLPAAEDSGESDGVGIGSHWLEDDAACALASVAAAGCRGGGAGLGPYTGVNYAGALASPRLLALFLLLLPL